MCAYPESDSLHIAVVGHGDGSLEADELRAAESVEDGLGRGSLVGEIVEAVADHVLHVRPRRTPVLLQTFDRSTLRDRGGEVRSVTRSTVKSNICNSVGCILYVLQIFHDNFHSTISKHHCPPVEHGKGCVQGFSFACSNKCDISVEVPAMMEILWHTRLLCTHTHVCCQYLFNGLVNLIRVGQFLVRFVAIRHYCEHQESIRIYVHLITLYICTERR